jgi:hypothetical protein
MKNGRVGAPRYAMSLVVSVMCLMMASCSGSKPIEVSDNDQSRFEELTKELRKKAQGGDASAQNELGLLYYEGRGVGIRGPKSISVRCICAGKALRKVAKWHCSGLLERQDKRMLWR